MTVVDPDRDARRGNLWRAIGIILTVGGTLLLIVGVTGILIKALSGDPETMFGAFDFFWMPFVGGFALAGGILAWVAGNLLRGSARFAAGATGRFPTMTSPVVIPMMEWSCPKCGNQNQVDATTCTVCGTTRP
jgi:Zn-finger in Ran binding protein and others